VTAFRRASIDGLRYAAYLVNYFGWEPCGPDSHLHVYAHLNIAAGKTALEQGERVDDVLGFMAHLLCEQLEKVDLFEWEAEPGRTAEDVKTALLAAADAAGSAFDGAPCVAA
jgi:hypothetical protein